MWNSSRQIWAASKTVRRKIMWKIWRELVLHIFQLIVLGSISFRLKKFFWRSFRYKLMYYYFYHSSDLRKIIQFLREIECIKFEKDCVSFFGECSRMSPYFIFWKMKILSYIFRQVSSLMKLWLEKITTGKKNTMLVYLVLWGNSFWYYLHT